MSLELARLAVRKQRSAVLGWSASWLLLVAVYVSSWPSVRDNGAKYDEILQDLPSAMRNLLGSSAEQGAFSSPEGYFTAELLAVTGPILVVTMGLILGSKAVAADEESGVVELLLVQPVTRTRLLVERLLASLLQSVLVLTTAAVGLLALGSLVDLGLSAAQVVRAFGVLALLAVQALCLGALLGAVTGRVGRSRAWGGAVLLVLFLLHAVGPSIPQVADAVPLSPFATALDSDPFRQALTAGVVLTLLVPSLVLVAASVVVFLRRDLRLP